MKCDFCDNNDHLSCPVKWSFSKDGLWKHLTYEQVCTDCAKNSESRGCIINCEWCNVQMEDEYLFPFITFVPVDNLTLICCEDCFNKMNKRKVFFVNETDFWVAESEAEVRNHILQTYVWTDKDWEEYNYSARELDKQEIEDYYAEDLTFVETLIETKDETLPYLLATLDNK